MNIEDFKKHSEVTYVKVRWITNNNSRDPFVGFIEIPYSYNKFCEFSGFQQKVICQSELVKHGLLIKEIKECNPDSFFEEVNEASKTE